MLKTHLFSRSYFTDNCFAEYEQRTLYGAPVVTLAMLRRLINCRFIIIIFIIKMVDKREVHIWTLQYCGRASTMWNIPKLAYLVTLSL